MKKVVHFEVHFVILYSKTELLRKLPLAFFYVRLQQGLIQLGGQIVIGID